VGSGGVGTLTHVAWALFASLSGVQTVHVPYRGETLAMTDLLGGQVQAVFPSMSPAMEHIRAGRLRALAVTGDRRAPALQSVPTIGEFLPGYEISGYWGISTPRNTPVEIVERLNREITASLADRRLNSRIVELGDVPFAVSATEFRTYVTQFTEKWGKSLRAAGIKAG
jgi:tripartite-type tricarboxylate transporter receptor subunit TctC